MSRAIAPAEDDARPRMETTVSGPLASTAERDAAVYSRSFTSISGRPSSQESIHQFRVKHFPNGDSYAGDWGAGGLPEGAGKYVWADGSSYDGEWSKGKKHGKGVFTWPSGATYDGEWVGGGMQGLGTYTGNDGSWYRGSWNANVKHGLGKKKYSNGDVYEGLWQFGVADGPGRYKWANGNEYLGEWNNGTMSGKGTFLWSSGDRYDGEWVDGFEHGHGTFTWADGASYEGTWSRGLKDGRGTYYPAGTRRLVDFTRASKRSLTLQREGALGPQKSDRSEAKMGLTTSGAATEGSPSAVPFSDGEAAAAAGRLAASESEPESDGGNVSRLAKLRLDGLARQHSYDGRDDAREAEVKMDVADDVVDGAAVVADGEAGAAAARESSLLRKIERRVSDPERRKSVSPKLSEFAARAASGGIVAAHEDGGKIAMRMEKSERLSSITNGPSLSMPSSLADRRSRSSEADNWRRQPEFTGSEPLVEPGEGGHRSPRSPHKLAQSNGEQPVAQEHATTIAPDGAAGKAIPAIREGVVADTQEEAKAGPASSAPEGIPPRPTATQPSPDGTQAAIPPLRSFPAPSMPGGLDKGPMQQPKASTQWGVPPSATRQSRVHPPPEGEDLAQPSHTPTTPSGTETVFTESPARGGGDTPGSYPPTLRVHTPRRHRDGEHRTRTGSGSLSGSAESSPSTQWRGSGSSPARTEAPTEMTVDDRNADGEGDWESSPKGPVPVVREYVHGALISETTKDGDELRSPTQLRKKGHRRKSGEIKRPGETIFKGHRSYDLMCNLQLGIRHTVSRINGFPKREIKPSDFRTEDEFSFPRSGSKTTPPHQSVDFKWKDYCPMVFRHLREMFYIDPREYMLSLCGDDALRELSSPGKSRAVFYLSKDDRFIIKTMRKTEVKVLLRMLPHYYEHVRLYENTLVTKFFGLHRVKPYKGGRVVRFVVMGNMFCSDLRIHRRFDLKGSSQGRSTDKIEIDENTTLKDLDLDMVFKLEEGWRDRLLLQIEHDCKFLEEQRIMDYSLLLGVHFRATSFFEPAIGEGPERESEGEDLPAALTEIDYGDYDDDTPGPLRSETDKVVRIAPKRSETMRPLHGSNGCTAELNLAFGRPRVHLGINMAATALPLDEETKLPDISRAYDVVLYFGIIDVLQEYDLTKKIEHTYKAMHYNAHSISAVEPSLYSHRFQTFVCKTFA